jgi:hypothetical protein
MDFRQFTETIEAIVTFWARLNHPPPHNASIDKPGKFHPTHPAQTASDDTYC